ncbi:major facilitator superfamily domain-containing protein [Hygrophoropsis aurantiaca]|uniref:Major facilitator superfamily domain-containing protein n=1 Tax=Hygrophoropsis aurantiaca TaxID=72124 RepID=A0ACB8AK00_9AGAM|nr:major facilitator superfamily domain-containing protein [Hygrophoropsis aurantiaca]
MSGVTGTEKSTPHGGQWRSSVPFITLVVGIGTAVDALNYSLVISVFPFRLERLGYSDISGLVGWLLVIYSGAMVLSTPVVAIISEHTHSRRGIMLTGVFSLLASQLILMEAPSFWVMCIGRFFEGISSSIILTVGLSLICDTTPEKRLGAHLGMAMAGGSLGQLIGPAAGGALYARWGYRAPFVFGMIFTAVEFMGRVLIIENPLASQVVTPSESIEDYDQSPAASDMIQSERHLTIAPSNDPELSILGVVFRMMTSPRTLVALSIILLCSVTSLAADVTVPLHTQAVWGLDSAKVGLVFLAAMVPMLISSIIAGALCDKIGVEKVALLTLIAGIPWWGALTKQFSLVFFIVSFAIQSFFVGAVASPVVTELAAVTRGMKGVGYAHMYAAFNIVYGVGNTCGSIIGGQVYGHLSDGWIVICFINIGITTLCACLVFSYTGETPLLRRFTRPRTIPQQ